MHCFKFKRKKNKKKIIKIKNQLSFLNQFVYLKRKYSSAKIIAITGSVGKTSLKNLIKNVLMNFGKTFRHQNHLTIILECL